jgi:hypothetical protein
MQNKENINVSCIAKIGIYKEQLTTKYSYKEEVSIFGITIIKGGWYYNEEEFEGEEMPENLKIVNGKLYEKAEVQLTLTNGNIETVCFDTNIEAQEYYEGIVSRGFWIEI